MICEGRTNRKGHDRQCERRSTCMVDGKNYCHHHNPKVPKKSTKRQGDSVNHGFSIPSRKVSTTLFKKTVTPIFSDEDSDLRNVIWSLDHWGYAIVCRRVDGKPKTFLAHRTVMSRKLGRVLLKGECTDHINRNRLDNRRENLRLVSIAENNQNQGVRVNNTSGYRGVSFYKANGKWHGRVKLNGKVYSAGYFSTSHEAGAKVSQLRKELGVLDGIGEGGEEAK